MFAMRLLTQPPNSETSSQIFNGDEKNLTSWARRRRGEHYSRQSSIKDVHGNALPAREQAERALFFLFSRLGGGGKSDQIGWE